MPIKQITNDDADEETVVRPAKDLGAHAAADAAGQAQILPPAARVTEMTPTVPPHSASRVVAAPHSPPRSKVPPTWAKTNPAMVADEYRPRYGSSIAPTTGTVTPPSGRKRWVTWLSAAAALVAIVIGVVAFIPPSKGELIVTVASDQGQLQDLRVYVDNQLRCDESPCKLTDIEAGTHLIRAAAKNHPRSADMAVVVEGGEQAGQHIDLAGDDPSAGIRVAAEGKELRVFVDGQDMGAPPLSLEDMDPGKHTVRVQGPGEFYEPYEESIELAAGEVRSLGPIRLKALRGRLKLEADAEGQAADVKVDGRRVSVPTELVLDADGVHEIIANKYGFARFYREFQFGDEIERTIRIEMEPATMSSGGGSRRAVNRQRSSGSSISLNSVPVASVIVDGVPKGSTPKTNLKVAPGSHNVVFVNRNGKRKIATVTVGKGDHKTVVVRF